jgi:hypothetical protein
MDRERFLWDDNSDDNPNATDALNRRQLLGAMAGGFALATSGLFLPQWPSDVAAREGTYGGQLGGRHDKNRQRRNKHREHGQNRDKHDKQKAPGNDGLKDVDIILITGKTAMSVEVWQQDPQNERKFVLKWPLRTVAANSRVEFLGSEPKLTLVGNYVGQSQSLFFQCLNPALFLTPKIWIAQGSWSKTGQVDLGDTYVQQPISEGESVAIDGFRVDRVTDSGRHKIFVINALN